MAGSIPACPTVRFPNAGTADFSISRHVTREGADRGDQWRRVFPGSDGSSGAIELMPDSQGL